MKRARAREEHGASNKEREREEQGARVKGTVTKAFADFKRTHQDDWAAQREKLTPEQQELISDTLISPSFYA